MSDAPQESDMPPCGTRLHQINEDDLATLERLLPLLQSDLFREMARRQGNGANAIRVKLRQSKDILSNVRWGYGPPLEVYVVPADEPPQAQAP